MPNTPRLVVSNTTPIITLSLVGQLPLLQQLYGTVLIPTAVKPLLTRLEQGGIHLSLALIEQALQQAGET